MNPEKTAITAEVNEGLAEEMDQSVGGLVRQLRGDRSQTEVAEFMRSRGFSWTQTTVWSVEKGQRPLRLIEAWSLTEFFDADPTILLSNEGQYFSSPAVDQLHRSRQLKEQAEQLDQRAHDLQAEIKQLRTQVGEL